MPSLPPPTYQLVPWPARLAILLVAIGIASLVLVAWGAGVRLSWMMTEVGERNGALERAIEYARHDAEHSPGEAGVIYLDPHSPSKAAPAKAR
ncbi:MAG: hypothetical protein WDN69_26380 [Aliidongia sp.]